MAVLNGDTTIGGVNVLNKLEEFRASLDGKANTAHNHSASQITSGTLPATRGGTGNTSLQATRNAMGLGNTTGALPIANGGTGATGAANARTNLGAFASTGGTVSGNMTVTGNLTLKGSGNYGNKINFGDGDYCFIHEPSDDHLVISATRNGIELIGTIQMPTAVVSSRPSSMTNGQVAFVYN